MKINPVFNQAQPANATNALLVKADDDFLSKLTLGQIIKGRVLRSYEGGRYLMDFYGQQKVVDSAVPLRQDEVIHGRVVGLGEHVELHRIAPQTANAAQSNDEAPRQQAPLTQNKWQRLVNETFERYRGTLSAEDAQLLQRMAARADAAADVALSGLVLSKLGLRIAPEFVQALFATFRNVAKEGSFPPIKSGPRLEMSAVHRNENDPEVIETLAVILRKLVNDLPETEWRALMGQAAMAASETSDPENSADTRANAALGGDAGGQERAGQGPAQDLSLARWILNAQAGGALAHRALTLPLMLDGRLVELDIALFEQAPRRDGQGANNALRHRQVVLSLDTEQLGRVDVQAMLAGDRIRVQVSSDDAEGADYLSLFGDRLSADIEALGLGVDELRYAAREGSSDNAVLRSLVEHFVTPGSVNRLI